MAWDPEHYTAFVRAEVPEYDRLQDEVARATEGIEGTRILELGTGTGVTTRRVLERHPGARLTGVDSSAEMLAAATYRRDLRLQDLREPLPEGPFDLASPRSPSTTSTARRRPTSSGAWRACSRPAGASCWPT